MGLFDSIGNKGGKGKAAGGVPAGKIAAGEKVRLGKAIGKKAKKGDLGVLRRVALPRGRGFEVFIDFDDNTSVKIPRDTPVMPTRNQELAELQGFASRVRLGARRVSKGVMKVAHEFSEATERMDKEAKPKRSRSKPASAAAKPQPAMRRMRKVAPRKKATA